MHRAFWITFVCVLGAFYLVLPVAKPGWVYDFVRLLNAYDPDRAFILDAARSALAVTLFVGMTNVVRLIIKFPRSRRFYLMLVPFPFALLYYVAQMTVDDPAFLPRNGFIFINAAATLLFAGYSVLAGLVGFYYREDAGDLRGG